MDPKDRPIANPEVVLREEFDDWAVLFDPDSGEAFGLNPVGVFIWKRLDGQRSAAEIIGELRQQCDDVPDEVDEHVNALIADLASEGLVGDEHPSQPG